MREEAGTLPRRSTLQRSETSRSRIAPAPSPAPAPCLLIILTLLLQECWKCGGEEAEQNSEQKCGKC